MRTNLHVLCRAAAAGGFELAGVRPEVGEDLAEGGRRLAALLEDEHVAVVLVEEDFYQALPETERRRWARAAVPLVVPFPAFTLASGGSPPDGFIADLLRRVIGYRVRLG